MGEVVHNKLVRDFIPNIITSAGDVAHVHTLTESEYRRSLLEKLVEEAQELLDSNGSLEERADVAEVLLALDELYGYDQQIVEQARIQKAKERGGFAMKVFLESTESND